MKENKKICAYCGEEITGDYGEIDGEIYCQNCVEEHFYTCEDCGKLISEDDCYYFDDRIYCGDCYNENVTTCNCCGCEIYVDDAIHTATNENICNDCYCDEYFTCDNCGEVYNRDDLNEYDGNYYCNDCFDECCSSCQFDYNNTTNRINNNIDKPLQEYCNCNAVCEYHDNPIEFVKRSCSNEKTNLYFGIELEITNKIEDLTAKASNFIANNLYCRLENDSSIPFNGFEIISDPMTLKKWFERKSKITQVFEELIKNNYVSHNANDCGLHIHASRSGLGETTEEQEKTIDNIILICENFKEELKKFSRRDAFNWCHFFKENSNEKELNIKKIKEHKGNKGRYQVINTTNRNTIEFRLNRGTLNINTFFASIELFNNIIELAKSNDFIGKTWKYLINMNNFNELIKYNKEREIKSHTRIKETSQKEEAEQIRKDKKAQRKREKSLILYKNLQEFRFMILQETLKYNNIKNDFYSYCINNADRSKISDLEYILKDKLSILNDYIINNTYKRVTANNEIITYYEFDKNYIITLKNEIITALNNYKNIDIFKYIFGETKDIEKIKVKEKTEKTIDLTNASQYQAVIICKQNKFLTDAENGNILKEKLQETIKKYGNIENIENMGVKNLAYTLQGYTKAHYFIIDFLTESQNIQEIERHFRINDKILKFIIIKKEN